MLRQATKAIVDPKLGKRNTPTSSSSFSSSSSSSDDDSDLHEDLEKETKMLRLCAACAFFRGRCLHLLSTLALPFVLVSSVRLDQCN